MGSASGCSLGFSKDAAILSTSFSSKPENPSTSVKTGFPWVMVPVLSKINAVIFDKTGTITQGKPVLMEVEGFSGFDEKDVLKIAASLEKPSEHPLAEPIVSAAKNRRISLQDVVGFRAIPGKGVSGKIRGKPYTLGSPKLAKKIPNQVTRWEKQGKTVMVLLQGSALRGILAVSDPIKPNAKSAVDALQKLGIEPVLLTGDNERTARAIARQAGISQVIANVMPKDKAEAVKKLQRKKMVVAMVGDGINDT